MATQYKLSLQDCLILSMQTIPGAGKLGEARTHRKLREDLELTEDENATIGYREMRDQFDRPLGRFRWSPEEARLHFKVVAISEPGQDAIIKALRDVESKGELTDDHIALWDIFVALHKSMKDRVVEDHEGDDLPPTPPAPAPEEE